VIVIYAKLKSYIPEYERDLRLGCNKIQ